MSLAAMWKPVEQSFTPQDFEKIAGELGVLPNQCTWKSWREYGNNAVSGNVWQAEFVAPALGAAEQVFDLLL